MSAAAIALLQGFREYAQSGKPFGYPAGSLQLIDQILDAPDPDVRGPMIRLPLADGRQCDVWVNADDVASLLVEDGETRVFGRHAPGYWWTSLTVEEVLSLIERASR